MCYTLGLQGRGSSKYYVSYYTSNDTCTGNQLKNKCRERVARIDDQSKLNEVKNVLSDGEEYWTGLWWDGSIEFITNSHSLNFAPKVNVTLVKNQAYLSVWYDFTI